MPGFAHEPNQPADRYPGAVFSPCSDPTETLRGACNDYRGYRGAPRLFLDVQAHRLPVDANERASPSATGRTLPPGLYLFEANVGRWVDRPHRVEESVYLAAMPSPDCSPAPVALGLVPHDACAYDVAPDGWVGNVVTTTGQHRWEGFEPTSCRMHGVVEVNEYAVCSPYRDGWLLEPNAYDASEGEFLAGCDHLQPGSPVLILQLPRGAWASPAFLWKDFPALGPAGVPEVIDLSGTTGPTPVTMECEGARLNARDALLLPAGNLGYPILSSVTATDRRRETATDFDVYLAYG